MAKRLKGSAPERPRSAPARKAETELTCYVHEGWAPRIVPASSRRGWMDATPESYAYRCLPLSIANSHGWEVLSPCGFSACWRGDIGTGSVEIVPDKGADPRKLPESLFGNGVITFHVDGVIRTSEGWNLWVGGPPNGIKDGIAPLAGVIETDWSPYTFTMNWRFTRPDVWIRFEENEPFCFFFPTPRGVVDGLKPELRPMEDNPELLQSYDGWSAARAAFQEWVHRTNPKAPSDQWQKLYYRGLHPQGQRGAPDHETKLRLSPFRQTGSRRVCPVDHTAGGRKPR
ncbi:MAG: hypothetical protein GC203_15190 [Phenylobacterium sp.]|uniref:DUF6065 family protein n=1 Tax=Phenylobacterium sp. TaxID=1871053 RepID=UPI0025DAAB66|nr:DUF6065 family protein [Phenylobacterium sp.]MBI1199204.1 hypothetical protein [Phenylobacterium sp.]